jgi:hypothetical protein
MMVARRLNGEDRSKIAARIVELSNGVLSIDPNPRSYIALKLGSRVAATVSKRSDRVQFIIASTGLHQEAERRFLLEKPPKSIPMHEHKYNFPGLALNDISANEPLFREIVQEAVRILSPKKN